MTIGRKFRYFVLLIKEAEHKCHLLVTLLFDKCGVKVQLRKKELISSIDERTSDSFTPAVSARRIECR